MNAIIQFAMTELLHTFMAAHVYWSVTRITVRVPLLKYTRKQKIIIFRNIVLYRYLYVMKLLYMDAVSKWNEMMVF